MIENICKCEIDYFWGVCFATKSNSANFLMLYCQKRFCRFRVRAPSLFDVRYWLLELYSFIFLCFVCSYVGRSAGEGDGDSQRTVVDISFFCLSQIRVKVKRYFESFTCIALCFIMSACHLACSLLHISLLLMHISRAG